MNFIDLVLAGREFPDRIDDYIDKWHEQPRGMEIYEFLGLTEQEYALWVEQPRALSAILYARRLGKTVDFNAAEDVHLLAARSQSQQDPEILLSWLRNRGLV